MCHFLEWVVAHRDVRNVESGLPGAWAGRGKRDGDVRFGICLVPVFCLISVGKQSGETRICRVGCFCVAGSRHRHSLHIQRGSVCSWGM